MLPIRRKPTTAKLRVSEQEETKRRLTFLLKAASIRERTAILGFLEDGDLESAKELIRLLWKKYNP